jgi:hypothetical protein
MVDHVAQHSLAEPPSASCLENPSRAIHHPGDTGSPRVIGVRCNVLLAVACTRAADVGVGFSIINWMPADWLADTDPKALEVYLSLHRRMTPGERLAQVFDLCEFQDSLQTANIRAMYPQACDPEVFLRLAARRLGRELMIAADPDQHP